MNIQIDCQCKKLIIIEKKLICPLENAMKTLKPNNRSPTTGNEKSGLNTSDQSIKTHVEEAYFPGDYLRCIVSNINSEIFEVSLTSTDKSVKLGEILESELPIYYKNM